MVLRDYQTKIIDMVRASMLSGKRAPLVVSPCGSGKTVMFSYFAKSSAEKGRRSIIIAHRDELIDQISGTLCRFGVQHSFISSGRQYDPRLKVQVASVMTLIRRLPSITAPDIVILDEAHHAVSESWLKVFRHFPKAWKIGVTATPSRLSGESLGDVFDDMILGPSVGELIDMGALCPYKLFAPTYLDLSGVGSRMGDYIKADLLKAVDKPSITGDAVREYTRLASGKRAVVFCVSVEHAKHVAAQFRAAGFPSVCLDGTMAIEIRRSIVDEFRRGLIKVVTSCDILSEGFDLPDIEVAVMLRPTQSLAVWIQQSGRALRPSPGKTHAVILDHAGNCSRHGLPDDPREWSLKGRDKQSSKQKQIIKVKVCPKCFAAQAPGKPTCSQCGHVFELQPRQVDQVEGELAEITAATLKRHDTARYNAKSYEDLVELGRSRGYRRPELWAKHVHMYRVNKQRKKI